ncbi:MAG: hexitol phosphatase HxpB [Deltaproteobacteria bacterium]|jgi:sugar-phosphatase|nr:hexitol phosphatase HxpB [Deltaproteobacteria bacterium]MBW2496628.1 hexitol phosphatase HxpB [Deltaproteobacteria bacterium]
MRSDGRERALIFDMDGVLIDSEPLWRQAEIETFAEVGLALSEEDCLQTQGLRIDEAVGWWFERRPWSGRACEDVARAVEARVIELVGLASEPLPGVTEAFEAARSSGWRLALASSSARRLIDAVLEHFGWSDSFEQIHSAEEEEHGKPHPAVYLTTAAMLGIEPERCVAIEDSANGVAAALAAGMRCIAVPALEVAEDPRLAIATRRLESLHHLPDALEELIREDTAGDTTEGT